MLSSLKGVVTRQGQCRRHDGEKRPSNTSPYYTLPCHLLRTFRYQVISIPTFCWHGQVRQGMYLGLVQRRRDGQTALSNMRDQAHVRAPTPKPLDLASHFVQSRSLKDVEFSWILRRGGGRGLERDMGGGRGSVPMVGSVYLAWSTAAEGFSNAS